ncbi:hypothetical protein PENSPDRAFT_647104 [Peniophora sp. CONT]|nr:hypothetical protein PENSPDRAFT_647104 [Peniophora sp. CONT]
MCPPNQVESPLDVLICPPTSLKAEACCPNKASSTRAKREAATNTFEAHDPAGMTSDAGRRR